MQASGGRSPTEYLMAALTVLPQKIYLTESSPQLAPTPLAKCLSGLGHLGVEEKL
jgi:hypothetical protein